MDKKISNKIEEILREYLDFGRDNIISGEAYSWEKNMVSRNLIFDAFGDIAYSLTADNEDDCNLKLCEAQGHVRSSVVEVWEVPVYEIVNEVSEFRKEILNNSKEYKIDVSKCIVYMDKQLKLISKKTENARSKKSSGNVPEIKQAIKAIKESYNIAKELYNSFINNTLPGLRNYTNAVDKAIKKEDRTIGYILTIVILIAGAMLGVFLNKIFLT